MPARVLPEHDVVVGEADGGRVHDLIRLSVLQDAVLVDAALVGEGVGADDCLVGLHHHARQRGHQTTGLGDLFLANVGDARRRVASVRLVHVVILAHVQGHHELLERGVASAFADAVDCALHLPSAAFDRGQEVGYCEAKIVVSVHADGHVLDAADVLPQAQNELLELLGRRVPHRVRHVDGRRPRLDRPRVHLVQELRIGPQRVLPAELHVVHEALGVGHHLRGDVQHLAAALAQPALHVDIAGGDEGVDAGEARALDRLRAQLDVLGQRSCQAADDGRVHAGSDHLCDLLDGLEVARRRDGEAGLDHVDAQARQLLRQRELLVRVHRAAWTLLSVPERGVEDLHSPRVSARREVMRGGLGLRRRQRDVHARGLLLRNHPQRQTGV
mmetsp:Transcript_14932/g.56703  ORF Transcript_14932/g.56703 Transcript_14932/m.56703 type:complete len:387 (+) Transcript_14932:815-1975(+)